MLPLTIVVFYLNFYASSVLLAWIVILLWLMLSVVWTTKILLYFFLLLCWNPPLLFSFFYFDFSTSPLSLWFLKRIFTFPISTFKLLVKNVRHTWFLLLYFVRGSTYSTCGIHFSTSFFFLPFIYFVFHINELWYKSKYCLKYCLLSLLAFLYIEIFNLFINYNPTFFFKLRAFKKCKFI